MGTVSHGENRKGERTQLYRAWASVKTRCSNPNIAEAHRYGGRGITYAKEWEQFEAFRDWANSNGYQPGLTLDRIDIDGNYEPSNCRWISLARNIQLGNADRKRSIRSGVKIGYELASKIKSLLFECQLTHQEIANQCGVKREAVGRIGRGLIWVDAEPAGAVPVRKRRILKRDERDAIKAMICQGNPTREVALAFGVTNGCVYQIRKELKRAS